MKLMVCTRCDRRVHHCHCPKSEQRWEDVELETPAEVEARLGRLLDHLAELVPGSVPAIQGIRLRAMSLSAPPGRTPRRAEIRSDVRGREVGRKLA